MINSSGKVIRSGELKITVGQLAKKQEICEIDD